MKEFLKALGAGIGCTPVLAISFFIFGTLIDQFVVVEVPAPSQWLLFPAAFFPICFGLFMRALLVQGDRMDWLELWQKTHRRKLVGQSPPRTIEEAWLQAELPQKKANHPLAQLLDSPAIWGWAALITFVPLALMGLWYGLWRGG